jgi:hypothetical protein
VIDSLFVDEESWEVDKGFLKVFGYFEEGWLVFEVRWKF